MFSFDEDRFYTMPPFFGGSPVRRKIALLDCQGVYLTVETDPGAVGKILPEGFELEKPEIALSFEHCASPSAGRPGYQYRLCGRPRPLYRE